MECSCRFQIYSSLDSSILKISFQRMLHRWIYFLMQFYVNTQLLWKLNQNTIILIYLHFSFIVVSICRKLHQMFSSFNWQQCLSIVSKYLLRSKLMMYNRFGFRLTVASSFILVLRVSILFIKTRG